MNLFLLLVLVNVTQTRAINKVRHSETGIGSRGTRIKSKCHLFSRYSRYNANRIIRNARGKMMQAKQVKPIVLIEFSFNLVSYVELQIVFKLNYSTVE